MCAEQKGWGYSLNGLLRQYRFSRIVDVHRASRSHALDRRWQTPKSRQNSASIFFRISDVRRATKSIHSVDGRCPKELSSSIGIRPSCDVLRTAMQSHSLDRRWPAPMSRHKVFIKILWNFGRPSDTKSLLEWPMEKGFLRQWRFARVANDALPTARSTFFNIICPTSMSQRKRGLPQ